MTQLRLRAFSTAAAVCFALCAANGAQAQTQVVPAPQNVLTLSSSATVEVLRDWLAITLSTSRDGADAAAVQTPLKQALDTALTEARKAAKPGQLEVRTGGFSISPRYAAKGGISGWIGSAELVIEGRDVAAISQLAGRLQTMSIARVSFTLSREAREKVEADVTAQAISRFRAQAESYAKQFGFGGFSVREVNVNTGADSPMQQPMVRAQMSAMASDSALPVEAGKATVTASVSGSIQMSAR
jgi:predicted secreted protein